MTDSLQASEMRHRAVWARVAVGAAALLVGLDLFIVNLSYAAISAGFPSATPQMMSWLLNGYAVVFAALLVPAGRLADRFGRRTLFRVGMVLFGLGALGATLANDVILLVVSRGLQGAGAALFVPAGMALLLASAPPDQHKRMMSFWTAVGSIASAAAPILGGLLTQVSWRLVFVIAIPLVVTALIASVALDETSREDARIPDLAGAALLVVGVGATVLALSHVDAWGLFDQRFQGVVVVAVIALAWFTRRALRHEVPAANLRLFANRTFSFAVFGMLSYFVSFAIMILGASLTLTRVWEINAITAGVVFAFGPGFAMISAIVVARVSLSERLLAACGAVLNALAAIVWLLAIGPVAEPLPWFFFGMVISGIAAGTGQVGFMTACAQSLPPAEYAVGTGMINTARQIGSALGVAILVAIVGTSDRAADFHVVWLVAAGFSLIAGVSALFLTPPREPDAEAPTEPSTHITPAAS